MTVDEALEYCYKHKNEFIGDLFYAGEDGVEQFNCLVGCLESGHIKPEQLADYGMDYE